MNNNIEEKQHTIAYNTPYAQKKRGFFGRWKQGLMDLTPIQIMRSQIVGYYGNIFGIIFATVFLMMNGLWYFIIFMVFTTFLQIMQLIALLQKHNNLKEIFEKQEER